MGKVVCFSINVDALLDMSDKRLAAYLKIERIGGVLDARLNLTDMQKRGVRFILLNDKYVCGKFDIKRGCTGHDSEVDDAN